MDQYQFNGENMEALDNRFIFALDSSGVDCCSEISGFNWWSKIDP